MPWSAPAAPRASTPASSSSHWPSRRSSSRRNTSTRSARTPSARPVRSRAARPSIAETRVVRSSSGPAVASGELVFESMTATYQPPPQHKHPPEFVDKLFSRRVGRAQSQPPAETDIGPESQATVPGERMGPNNPRPTAPATRTGIPTTPRPPCPATTWGPNNPDPRARKAIGGPINRNPIPRTRAQPTDGPPHCPRAHMGPDPSPGGGHRARQVHRARTGDPVLQGAWSPPGLAGSTGYRRVGGRGRNPTKPIPLIPQPRSAPTRAGGGPR